MAKFDRVAVLPWGTLEPLIWDGRANCCEVRTNWGFGSVEISDDGVVILFALRAEDGDWVVAFADSERIHWPCEAVASGG